jgi:hypothetical protein
MTNPIYPTLLKKYVGSVSHTKSNTYQAKINSHGYAINKTFKTRDQAENFIKEKNILYDLPIKNMIYDMGDHYSVKLNFGEMLVDKSDLQLVQQHVIHNSRNNEKGYACIVKNKTEVIPFHNLLLNHIPTEITVDHINRNRLDNRRINLRLVDKSIQKINQCKSKNNTSNYTGVLFEKRETGSRWIAIWNENGKQTKKSFSVKKYGYENAKNEAIKYRQGIVTTHPKYKEALKIN